MSRGHGRASAFLIAGDAVRTGERFRTPLRLMNFDHEQALRSIVTLADLDGLDLAVSGHGAPARDATTKLRQLAAEIRR